MDFGLLTQAFDAHVFAHPELRSREFHAYSKVLRDRITLVQSGLENVGITMRRLKTDELVQLYYGIYNPTSSQKEKFTVVDELNAGKSVLF